MEKPGQKAASSTWPGSWTTRLQDSGYNTTDLARDGSVMNPIYFDLGEAFDTVSHEVRIVKSTATYVATRTT